MASKKSKSKIYEFNPQLYPTRLWVGKAHDLSIEDIDKEFYALDENNERIDFKDACDFSDVNCYATTYAVSNKESGWRGCLVILRRKDMPLSTISHEASHCTDWLLEQLQIESGTRFMNGEARAYYHEWAWNRIYEVKQGKVK